MSGRKHWKLSKSGARISTVSHVGPGSPPLNISAFTSAFEFVDDLEVVEEAVEDRELVQEVVVLVTVVADVEVLENDVVVVDEEVWPSLVEVDGVETDVVLVVDGSNVDVVVDGFDVDVVVVGFDVAEDCM